MMALIAYGFWNGCGEELTNEQRLDRFRALVQQEKYDSAEKELKTLASEFPTDSIVLYWGGKLYFETERYDTAMSYANKLTSLYARHLDGYHLLYDAAKEIGNSERQLWAVSQLGYFAEDRRRYYNEIAELNLKLGYFGLTVSTCYTILEYDPDNLRVMFLLASSLASIGQFDSASIVMERIDRLYPGNPEIKSNLGSYLAEMGRYDEAEITFLELVRDRPDFIPGWYGLGNVMLQKGDTADAIDAYRKVFDFDSTFLGVDSILREIEPAGLIDTGTTIEADFSG